MVTIQDVAARSGVSIATVSNVINRNGKVKPATEQKVQNAILELGYIPNYIAKSLKTNVSRAIGVIVEEIKSFSTPEIIDGICEFCESNDYNVNLCDLRLYSENGFNQKRFVSSLNSLLSTRVAGLIYVGANMRDVSNLSIPKTLPTVYTYCHPVPGQYTVSYDDYGASIVATDYLALRGHTRIGLICGVIDQTFVHQRMIGFQTALMKHALKYEPEYVKVGGWDFYKAKECAIELLRLPVPPTALFVMNDIMACGVLSAAAEMGVRIPQDLSIVGFDNRDCSAFSVPRVTTMAIPLREIGYTSAKKLLSLLNPATGATSEINTILTCKLIERESAIARNV